MLSTYATAAIFVLAGISSALPYQYSHLAIRQSNSTGGAAPTGTAVGAASTGFGIPPPETPIDAETAAANAALAKEANAEITAVDRFNTLLTVGGAGEELLSQQELDERVVFNFNRAPEVGEGGRFALANQKTFPLLVEQGISTAVGFLNPCSMNAPHVHPRATEWLTVVQGQVQSGMMLEDAFLPNADTGAQTTEVQVQLTAFEGTVFPQGSIHYQFNPTCEPATFVASLNSDDPGTSRIAQNFFFLDEDIVDITLGNPREIDGSNIDQFRNTLPANLVQDVETCLSRCGL